MSKCVSGYGDQNSALRFAAGLFAEDLIKARPIVLTWKFFDTQNG